MYNHTCISFLDETLLLSEGRSMPDLSSMALSLLLPVVEAFPSLSLSFTVSLRRDDCLTGSCAATH